MLKIGLTGSPGTGKSTVLKLLNSRGVHTVSSDALVRGLYKPNSPVTRRVVKEFGADYLKTDGRINRRKLRGLIFSNSAAKRKLELIIHPKVARLRKEALSKLKAKGAKIVVFEVPLLFEAELKKEFDKTVLVTASKKKQIERLTARDKISQEDALLLINSQMPLSRKKKLADFVITNNGSLEELKSRVRSLRKSKLKI